MVCQWFGLETTRTVSSDLAPKPVATIFSGLASKPVVTVSPGLALKPVVGFLVESQNQNGRFVNGLTSKPLGRFANGLTSKPLGRFSLV
jgi:hypothetical protein